MWNFEKLPPHDIPTQLDVGFPASHLIRIQPSSLRCFFYIVLMSFLSVPLSCFFPFFTFSLYPCCIRRAFRYFIFILYIFFLEKRQYIIYPFIEKEKNILKFENLLKLNFWFDGLSLRHLVSKSGRHMFRQATWHTFDSYRRVYTTFDCWKPLAGKLT